MNDIGIQTFTDRTAQQIQGFCRMWLAGNKERGHDEFPLAMPEADWIEQFQIYLDTDHGEFGT